jgi:hypothetical protein
VRVALSLVVIGTVVSVLAAAPARAADRRQVVKVHQGKVRAELSYVSAGSSWHHGRLRIWSGKRLLAQRRIDYGEKWAGKRPLAIRQLDASGAPEVLFTEFSGGSCGCVTTSIYDGPRRVKAPWALDPAIRDADGDGKPEFHGTWGLGGRVWGSRADYRFPLRVWSYHERALHDVTRSFPAEVQADQAGHYAEYERRVKDGRVGGARQALAAYAADGFILGQGDAAMAVLQAEADAGRLDDPDGVSTSEFLRDVRTLVREQGIDAGLAHAAAVRRHTMHAKLGKVRAELSYVKTQFNTWEDSRLRIWKGKRLIVNRKVDAGAPLYGMRPIAVRQLDGAGDPEVLLIEFSGGNGCCFTNWIYAGAKRIKAPWLDPPKIRDADGDGKPEFHGVGGIGSWGARSQYRLPVVVWSYANGAIHDVTRSFPAEVQADQADHYAVFQQAVGDGDAGYARNAMAAYVADGYTLGQGDAAMAVAQAAADAGQLDQYDSSGEDYLNQLRTLLRQAGYA